MSCCGNVSNTVIRTVKLDTETKREEFYARTEPLTVDFQKVLRTEHSCRFENPDSCEEFRRDNNHGQHNGQQIDMIWCIQKTPDGDEEANLQAFRYPIEDWDEDEARKHCEEEHDGEFEAAKPKNDESNQSKPVGLVTTTPKQVTGTELNP